MKKYNCRICGAGVYTADTMLESVLCAECERDENLVEVVRCKDCKWSFRDTNGLLLCEEWECQDTLPNGYCAWGERRAE